ncbi:bacterial low temperature requirement A protein-domain-containing protein [Scheffersomyces amazonensis]|uniref:bacterial low temperature requirement A protein-domain-containing protein n=1 Tax=Scheffersomyces amazonensis TaxID=1078765 RepID=UPI00315D62A0
MSKTSNKSGEESFNGFDVPTGLEDYAREGFGVQINGVNVDGDGNPNITEVEEILTDSEDDASFIKRYGEIEFQYIRKPRERVWFIKPHALNYFKDGVLYRTKGERSSEKLELFLDLLYVGIVANLASDATEHAGGIALLKYIMLFIPAYMVWSDVKDATNYYYNEDLSQKTYMFWIFCLLTMFANSHYDVTVDRKGAAYTIVPYIFCRISLAIFLLFYSFFIPELKFQQRTYATLIFITCCLWIPVIFISNRAKIGLGFAIMILENLSFVIPHHPWFKKKLGLKTSTALNIEHEVERYGTFVTIAIGEFLMKIGSNGSLGVGFSLKFLRGIFLLVIAYILFWLYNYGSTTKKAVHALRRSGLTACLYIYGHLPLIASIVLAADAGGDIIAFDNTHIDKRSQEIVEEQEEPNMFALSFFFTGGLGVALASLCLLGMLDKCLDPPGKFLIPRFWRVIWRLPVGIGITMLAFAEMSTTLLMGVISSIMLALLVFESIMATPVDCLISTKVKSSDSSS